MQAPKLCAMSRELGRAMREAWIVSAVRTPVGRYGGALRAVRPDDLAVVAIKAAVERAGIAPDLIEDVILGNANGAGEENRNVARMAGLLAGLPIEVGGQTVNRLCGSGLQAINSAAHAIMVGDGDAFVAGGVESMTRAPYVMLKPEAAYDRGTHELVDTTLGWRFTNPAGRHAPPVLDGRDRRERRRAVRRLARGAGRVRAHAASSARRGHRKSGRVADEIVAVVVRSRRASRSRVDRDEHPRAGHHRRGAGTTQARVQGRRHRHGRQQLGHQRRRQRSRAGRARSWRRASA